MSHDEQLRNQTVKLLQGGQAFVPLHKILENISVDEAGKIVTGLPYTIWQLIEHLRIALDDILNFSIDPTYQSPEWPHGYWPQEKAPPDQVTLDSSIVRIHTGVNKMINLVQDPANNLYVPFPHGSGQNLLREALLVAEHNAYHAGQIVLLRRLAGTWLL